MKLNTRALSVAFIGATSILLLLLYIYQGIGGAAFLLGTFIGYLLLGFIVGKKWPVNAWQVSITSSIPPWIFLGWRLYTSRDPYNISLDLSLFLWLPIIALLSSYVGTYFARWIAIRTKRRIASEE